VANVKEHHCMHQVTDFKYVTSLTTGGISIYVKRFSTTLKETIQQLTWPQSHLLYLSKIEKPYPNL
jgi:hypothetical protein